MLTSGGAFAQGGLESAAQFLTVLVIFIAVLALTYLTTRWTANYQKGRLSGKNVEAIETFRLAANKYIQIVRVGDTYLVLALCKDSVTMLTQLSGEQLSLAGPEQNGGFRFQDLLEKAKKGKPKE